MRQSKVKQSTIDILQKQMSPNKQSDMGKYSWHFLIDIEAMRKKGNLLLNT